MQRTGGEMETSDELRVTPEIEQSRMQNSFDPTGLWHAILWHVRAKQKTFLSNLIFSSGCTN